MARSRGSGPLSRHSLAGRTGRPGKSSLPALELLEWQIGVLHESPAGRSGEPREARAVSGASGRSCPPSSPAAKREQLVHQQKGAPQHRPAPRRRNSAGSFLPNWTQQLEALRREVERLSRERPAPRRLYSIIPYEGPLRHTASPDLPGVPSRCHLSCSRKEYGSVPEDFQGIWDRATRLDSALRADSGSITPSGTGVRDEDPYLCSWYGPAGLPLSYVARAASGALERGIWLRADRRGLGACVSDG